jgi:hypothetical protein
VIPGALAVLLAEEEVVGVPAADVGEDAVVPGLAVVAVLEGLLELHAVSTSAAAPKDRAALRQEMDIRFSPLERFGFSPSARYPVRAALPCGMALT